MLAGRRKSSTKSPAKRLARNADTSTAALTDPDVAREAGRDTPTPKVKRTVRNPAERRRGLLRAIMQNKLLTRADQQAIQQAHDEPLTPGDLAAVVVFELKLAERLYELGELDAKGLMIAVNKVASHAAASVQLGSDGGGGGANITITFDGAGPTSVRDEIQSHAPPDPVVGDIIDTDG